MKLFFMGMLVAFFEVMALTHIVGLDARQAELDTYDMFMTAQFLPGCLAAFVSILVGGGEINSPAPQHTMKGPNCES
jgi:hypothetical protein